MFKLIVVLAVTGAVVFGNEVPETCGDNQVWGCEMRIIEGDMAAACEVSCRNGHRDAPWGNCEDAGLDPAAIPPIKCHPDQPWNCNGCGHYGCVCKVGYYRDSDTNECISKDKCTK